MPDPADAFLAAAVRSFDDNAELQVIARREWAETIAKSPEAPDSFEEATRRFDEVYRRGGRRWDSWAVGAVVLISLLLAAWTAFGINRQWDELICFAEGGMASGEDVFLEKWIAGRTPAEQLLLVGDPDADSLEEQLEALWDSDPENPAYFGEYARACLSDSKQLPADFAETAARIDPGNGYFPLLEVMAQPSDCVEQRVQPRKRGEPWPVPQWDIVNESAYRAVLSLLDRANSMPRFESYESELMARRVPLLPPATDTLSLVPRFQYVFGRKSGFVGYFQVLSAVSAKAEECLQQGDREGFLRLRQAWDKFLARHIPEVHPTMFAMVVWRGIASAPQQNFIAAAEGLGLVEEAATLRERSEGLSKDRSPVRIAMNNEPVKSRLANHGGYLEGSSFSHQVPSMEELRPGRLAEYEWFGRVGALGAWVSLVLAGVLVWSYRFRSGGPVRRMARRLGDLVREKDQAGIIAAGIGLPLLLGYAVTYLTPLGARDWSFPTHGGMIPIGQLLSMVVLMLLLPVLIAKIALDRRAGWAGVGFRPRWSDWVMIASAAVALLLFGMAQQMAGSNGLRESSDNVGFGAGSFFDLDPTRTRSPGSIWLWTATGLLAVSMIYLLIGAVRSIFSRREHLVRRSILARLTLPAYAAAMLCFAVAMPLHHAAERYWVGRDTLLQLTPENDGLPALEAEVARQDRRQLLEALGNP